MIPQLLEQLRAGGAAAFVGDGEEQVLGADELVLQPVGFGLRLIGDQLRPRRHARLRAAVRLRELGRELASLTRNGGRVLVQLAQQLGDDAFALLRERDQQVFRLELRVVALLRQFDRRGDRFARLLGVFVDIHMCSMSLSRGPSGPRTSFRT